MLHLSNYVFKPSTIAHVFFAIVFFGISISAIIITWGGIPAKKGVKAVFVHGNDTTAYFWNFPARAAAMKIGDPLRPFFCGDTCLNAHNDNRYRQIEIVRQEM